MAQANLIYRGPHDRHPRTVSDKPVAAALLPGTFVTEGTATLTQAAAPGPLVRLLAHRDFYAPAGSWFNDSDPLKTAYAVNETGVAYILEPGQQYQAAVAAGDYSFGQPLTIGAAGRLTAAAAGKLVVAFASAAAHGAAAGDLLDVEIANFYPMA
ncbi:hypothetical protein DJFAAGMI_01279 [Comamonas sp. PE63]|uniref:DUF2190 family protein n=1 Tax=Comamonas brasiliensis TaxID=1812482 RepID=A0ABS5LR62_9BURK|nr:hypothetical protein [Comamonas sp. PE63]MBS3018547.1 hypothetical protein [Comamonas sp. PE63]